MAYTYSKTDWKPTDYFNAVHHNRIVANLNAIRTLAENLIEKPISITVIPGKTYNDVDFARDFNTLQDDVDIINRATFNAPLSTKITFRDNGFTPTYIELNRIEEKIDLLYRYVKVNTDTRTHLAFKLGYKVFSALKRV